MRHVSAVIVVAVFVCLVTFPKHQHVTSTIFMTTANAATVPPAGITTADVTPADVTTADIATVTSPQPAARDVYSAATTAKTLNSTTAEPLVADDSRRDSCSYRRAHLQLNPGRDGPTVPAQSTPLPRRLYTNALRQRGRARAVRQHCRRWRWHIRWRLRGRWWRR